MGSMYRMEFASDVTGDFITRDLNTSDRGQAVKLAVATLRDFYDDNTLTFRRAFRDDHVVTWYAYPNGDDTQPLFGTFTLLSIEGPDDSLTRRAEADPFTTPIDWDNAPSHAANNVLRAA